MTDDFEHETAERVARRLGQLLETGAPTPPAPATPEAPHIPETATAPETPEAPVTPPRPTGAEGDGHVHDEARRPDADQGHHDHGHHDHERHDHERHDHGRHDHDEPADEGAWGGRHRPDGGGGGRGPRGGRGRGPRGGFGPGGFGPGGFGPGGFGPGGFDPSSLPGFGAGLQGLGFGPGGPRGPGGPGDPGRHGGMPPWMHLMRQLGQQFGGPAFEREFGKHFGGPGGERGRRGPRARRGDVRAAILDVLAGDEMNGYQLIQQIADRTDGQWKPSPGSVYPTVQQLEDEGLVQGREVDGRRVLRLTDAGRHYVEEHGEEMAATWRPFERPDESGPGGAEQGPDDASRLMPITGQVLSAMWQISTTGTAQQRAEAAEILTETRRRLYGLLADGDPS
ncbi:PadR family transcriptional regulator [Terracoccus luteus]|uniref:DNA-binding PadR family transcriptional regulator n=1 Tax=Terracoccus luteus TaxID=53356 RepID=A0A839PZT5_9MICO|nr:PadR family transcriptional regulator [Terracoccus luteus]MBB2987516.1 DNA-binding PadR family transcriptional regulator [Terracoccus luteus]MCP2173167.1 DNA-binding PadR family transcriptional regulator [Terracoccus luteus]